MRAAKVCDMPADLRSQGEPTSTWPSLDDESDPGVVAAVRRLSAAAASGVPCAPVRDLIDRADVARAYRVQRHLVDAELAKGDRRVGRKIGLTSPAVQTQLGVDQPDFGTLLASMVVLEDQPVAASRLLQPRIEAEIAFILGADITDLDPSIETVAAAVGVARPALEIVDSRVAGWDISIADTVADNASSGMFVLGEQSLTLDELDPVAVTMSMTQNGEEVSSGNGAACLGSPLIALQWLARVSAGVGDPLRAGEVILSGALGPMAAVQAGSTYEAELAGLGSVRAIFAPTN
jgi:2-keto-4-pentenoate hydratase